MSDQTNSRLLDGYVTETELARELKRSERTLIRWRVKREGPPVTFVGRTPMYRLDSAIAWLKSRETRGIRRSNQRNR
jgi:hypothetical protein